MSKLEVQKALTDSPVNSAKPWKLFSKIFLVVLFMGCGHKENKKPGEKPFFNQWLQSWELAHPKKNNENIPVAKPRYLVIESGKMPIKGILRSMQGPFEVVNFTFENNNFSPMEGEKELLWLTGYYVEVFDPETKEKLSDDFLCHNNLNLLKPEYCDWRVKTQGSNTRLFTLTEGQTHLNLPAGCGIPVLSNQPLEVAFQVLNHNQKDLIREVKQRVIISYYKNSDLPKPFKALYQQSAFVTEQTQGPEGFHSNPVILKNSGNLKTNPGVNELSCGIEKPLRGDYNPFQDEYGRKFTGHWKVPPGDKIWKTPCSRMLNIQKPTRVHFISVHVHPFCEWVKLADESAGNPIIFESRIRNFDNKIGLERISTYSSEEGLMLYPENRYYLQTAYHNTDKITHTGMATMFLYCEE